MRAIAVIGSCWGDEGKGAAVDVLTAANPLPIVVRHNSGAQAGHTATAPDGRRHIFSHFCSGALAGAPGHLSEYFVINPRIFCIEREELLRLGANTNLTVDPGAILTTPYDVAINRAIERKRGVNRHGSVGVGFGETIERSERGFSITAWDIHNNALLVRKLAAIKREYVPVRLAELGIDRLEETDLDEDYMDEIDSFRSATFINTLAQAVRGYETIIFEGAQGLLLDQRRGMTFPYVTRSNTGLQNVMALLDQLRLRAPLQVIYMMRPYLTRHGAGPLPNEGELTGIDVVDPTNKTGEWQGALRLAPIDFYLIPSAIRTDLREASNVEPYIGMSCLDQVKDRSRMHAIVDVMVRTTGLPLAIGGHGSGRDQYQIAFPQPLVRSKPKSLATA